MNVTSEGPCEPWSAMFKYTGMMKLYDYAGLREGSYCRNTYILHLDEKPWCFSRGKKVICDIPRCEGESRVPLPSVSHLREITTMMTVIYNAMVRFEDNNQTMK